MDETKVPQNCMECECYKFAKFEVGKTVKIFCYGGLKPKLKPFRKKEHQESTPRWCPKKKNG